MDENIVRGTLTDLAISLSHLPEATWEQVQILCHFLPHLPPVASPTTPTNSEEVLVPTLPPFKLTNEILISFETVSLFLSLSNSKFSNLLFQNLLSILQNAPNAEFPNSERTFIAFFFRQAVARLRWIAEECDNLARNDDFIDFLSKMIQHLHEKLVSYTDADITMATIAMLIGMYEGISVSKEEVRREIETSGGIVLNMELTLKEAQGEWHSCDNVEEIQRLVDVSLAIVDNCRQNVVPNGFQNDFSNYYLQPSVYVSLSQFLATSPLPDNSLHIPKLSSYIKPELTQLISAYKEMKSGQELKYYTSFQIRFGALLKLTVTLWQPGDNWLELCDTLVEIYETKLKTSLDTFQLGVKLEIMAAIAQFVKKNPACRVSIFDAIVGQLESSFCSRVSRCLQNKWILLKLPELDQISNDILPRRDATFQEHSYDLFVESVLRVCLACQGGELFEGFIGTLTNRLISIKLDSEVHILQSQIIIDLLVRICTQLDSVSVLQTLHSYVTYSSILGALILNEIPKIAEFQPPQNVVMKTGEFLLDTIASTKNAYFREIGKRGFVKLLQMDDFKYLSISSSFALRSFEKLVSVVTECVEMDKNARTKETELISNWLSIVSQCVAVSGCIGDTKDLRVVTLFRDFWLTSVVLDLIYGNSYLVYLQNIASCTPIFLNRNNTNFFAFLKGSSLSDKSHLPKPLVTQLRHTLAQLLDNHLDILPRINRLDPIMVIFLIALHSIEIMRLQSFAPKLPTILFYCEDRVIQHLSADFHKVLCVMANQILGKGVAIKAAQVPPTVSRDMELKLYATMLVPRLCTLDHSVRDIACNTLNSLVNQFTHLLLNKELVCTIFSIHSLLYASIHSARGKPISHQIPISVPNTDFVLNLPDTLDKKRKIFTYFEGEMKRLFKSAVEYSAVNFLALLQGLLVDCEGSAVCIPGMLIAMNLFNQSDYMGSLFDPISAPGDCFSVLNYPFENSQKLQTIGRIKTEITSKDFIPNLMHSLDQSDLVVQSESAVCYLALTRNATNGILEKLFHNLARGFEVGTATAVLNNLTWLIAVSPEFESSIFAHSCQLILATKDLKKGIFAEYKFTNDRVSITTGTIAETEVLAHRELIIFIQTRYRILKYKYSFHTEILLNVMSSILGLFVGLKGVSCQPIVPVSSTVGVIFRILNICLDILSCKSIPDNFDTYLFRKRIYTTALHYFSFEFQWATHSFELLRNDVGMLFSFWSHINRESDIISETNTLLHEFSDLDEILVSRESSSACVSPDLPLDFPAQRSHSLTNLNLEFPDRKAKKTKSSNLSRKSGKSAKSKNSFHKHSPPLSHTNESIFDTNDESYKETLLLEKEILVLVLHSELLRLISWLDPLVLYDSTRHFEEIESFPVPPFHKKIWLRYLHHMWQLSPYLALQSLKRLRVPLGSGLQLELMGLVARYPTLVMESSYALEIFLTKNKIELDANELSYILYWEKPLVIYALTLFTTQFPQHPLTSQLAYSILLTASTEQLIFYIPQIVQSLRSDQLGFVWHSIIGAAKKSQLFTHQIVWNMKTNMFTDEHSESPDEHLHDVLSQLIKAILNNLSGKSLEFYQREIAFFKKVTGISGEIRDIPIGPARDQACLERFALIEPEIGVYLPSNPECAVVGIDHASAKPMQSAEKAPFRAKFKVKKFNLEDVESINQSDSLLRQISQQSVANENNTFWQSCIFKVGDDVRQDMLALQIMTLFKEVLETADLELFFKPYKVVCTEPGCGIIECVPNAISRDQLGRKTDTNLFNYFIATFGDVLSEEFKVARLNFIKSLAAYSVFSFLIQIKDRHNGNILITNEGHIIHIDFGFMFESSPGGNLGFEPHLKLTEEMLLIMGGDVNAAPYIWFRELCVRGYLALRPFCDEVVRMVSMMLETKLPCFRGHTIEPLKSRFSPGISDKQATHLINKVIDDSLLNFRTKGYDLLQKIQNNIAS